VRSWIFYPRHGRLRRSQRLLFRLRSRDRLLDSLSHLWTKMTG
jgi:hypothetical protein